VSIGSASENSEQVAGIDGWVIKFIKENPIKAFSSTTITAGFLFLLIFFGRIEYMPDMVLSDSISVLYAVASLGLLISVYTMFVMVMPGFALSAVKNKVWKVSDLHVCCVSLAASLIWVVWLSWFFETPWIDDENIICVVLSTGLIVVFLSWFGVFWSCRKGQGQPGWVKGKVCCLRNPGWFFLGSCAVTFVISVSMILPLFFIGLFGAQGDVRSAVGGDLVLMLALPILAVAGVAALIACVKSEDVVVVAAIVAPLLLVMVLSVTRSFSAIPEMAVRVLGLGEISAARLVVSRETCDEINRGVGQTVCFSVPDERVSVICPVIIKSRIGSQVVLDFAALSVERQHAANEKSDHKGERESARLVWLTTSGAVDGKSGKRIARRVFLEKSKILVWRPLPRIFEGDKQDENLKEKSSPYVGASLAGNWRDDSRGEGKDEKEAFNSLFSGICGDGGAQAA